MRRLPADSGGGYLIKILMGGCGGINGGHRFGLEQAGRRSFQIPDNPDFRKSEKDVVGDIDFPPEEALAARKRVVVVIVVPTFA